MFLETEVFAKLLTQSQIIFMFSKKSKTPGALQQQGEELVVLDFGPDPAVVVLEALDGDAVACRMRGRARASTPCKL